MIAARSALLLGLAGIATGCLETADVCTSDDACDPGERCRNGVCTVALEDTGADTDTGADGTISDGDAADSEARDSAPPDTAPPRDTETPPDTAPSEPCVGDGRYTWCPADCAPSQFPLRVCVNGSWGACVCTAFLREHVRPVGAGTHVGLSGTPSGSPMLCYDVPDVGIVAGRRIDDTFWSVFPVSLYDSSGAGTDCDIAAEDDETAHVVYRQQLGGGGTRLTYHRYPLGMSFGPAEFPQPANTTHGHAPRIAVGADGSVQIVSGYAVSDDEFVLRHYRRAPTGGWSTDEFAPLPLARADLAFDLCDDGTPLVAYGRFTDTGASPRIARAVDGDWDTSILASLGGSDVGAGAAIACRDGLAHGVFLDRGNARLLDVFSPTPRAIDDSYTTTKLTTTRVPTAATDVAIADDTLFAAFGATNGDVWLAARPTDLSAPWRFYGVASGADLPDGDYGGDVALWIDPTGRPVVLYFGLGGASKGSWVALFED